MVDNHYDHVRLFVGSKQHKAVLKQQPGSQHRTLPSQQQQPKRRPQRQRQQHHQQGQEDSLAAAPSLIARAAALRAPQRGDAAGAALSSVRAAAIQAAPTPVRGPSASSPPTTPNPGKRNVSAPPQKFGVAAQVDLPALSVCRLEAREDVLRKLKEHGDDPEFAEFTCPICWDPFWQPVRTSCGHAFCEGCLLKAVLAQLGLEQPDVSCPLCRHPLNVEDVSADQALLTRIRMALSDKERQELDSQGKLRRGQGSVTPGRVRRGLPMPRCGTSGCARPGSSLAEEDPFPSRPGTAMSETGLSPTPLRAAWTPRQGGGTLIVGGSFSSSRPSSSAAGGDAGGLAGAWLRVAPAASFAAEAAPATRRGSGGSGTPLPKTRRPSSQPQQGRVRWPWQGGEGFNRGHATAEAANESDDEEWSSDFLCGPSPFEVRPWGRDINTPGVEMFGSAISEPSRPADSQRPAPRLVSPPSDSGGSGLSWPLVAAGHGSPALEPISVDSTVRVAARPGSTVGNIGESFANNACSGIVVVGTSWTMPKAPAVLGRASADGGGSDDLPFTSEGNTGAQGHPAFVEEARSRSIEVTRAPRKVAWHNVSLGSPQPKAQATEAAFCRVAPLSNVRPRAAIARSSR